MKFTGHAIFEATTSGGAAKTVTYDFHRMMDGATKLKCSEFGDAIIKHMTGGSTSVEPKSKPVMAGA